MDPLLILSFSIEYVIRPSKRREKEAAARMKQKTEAWATVMAIALCNKSVFLGNISPTS